MRTFGRSEPRGAAKKLSPNCGNIRIAGVGVPGWRSQKHRGFPHLYHDSPTAAKARSSLYPTNLALVSYPLLLPQILFIFKGTTLSPCHHYQTSSTSAEGHPRNKPCPNYHSVHPPRAMPQNYLRRTRNRCSATRGHFGLQRMHLRSIRAFRIVNIRMRLFDRILAGDKRLWCPFVVP